MLRKKQRAAAPTTAQANKHRKESYKRGLQLSNRNLKESIGLLLLYLQTPVGRNEYQKGWCLFEVLLRQYLGDKA